MKKSKQCNTEFHRLHKMISDMECYTELEDRKPILDLVKELFLENQELVSSDGETGSYGIRYKTIHDDSMHHDNHELWFTSEGERNAIITDWENDVYWDNTFETEVNHRTPSPNYNESLTVKVHRVGGKIYVEEKGTQLEMKYE